VRRARKVLVGSIAVAGLCAAGGLVFIHATYPRVRPPRHEHVEATPERLTRGRYLVESVAVCVGCHSRRDFDLLGAPIVGKPGGGWGDRRRGGLPMRIVGLPGDIYPGNITPDRETGLGAWTDGEIIRAVREGIHRDGTALFGLMPFEDYRNMSDQDVRAVVAYLHTLEPVRQRVPRSQITFPMSTIMLLVPRPVAHVPEPDRTDRVRYGRYLAAMGGCIECHTPFIQGRRHEDRLMAGGNRFETKDWTVWSANLTPDRKTGLRFDEDAFVALFRSYRAMADGRAPRPRARHANTVMPWMAFSHLEEADLRAIWAWLHSLPAIGNHVDTGRRAPERG